MTISRKNSDERVKAILLESALSWIDIHESEHEHLPDQSIAPLELTANGFISLAESAYLEAVSSVSWSPDGGYKPRGSELTVDEIMVDCPDDMTPSVYIHRDANGVVLYVGSTIHPRRRQISHRRDSPWWKNVESVTFVTFPDKVLMSRAEVASIWEHRPAHNITYNQWEDS